VNVEEWNKCFELKTFEPNWNSTHDIEVQDTVTLVGLPMSGQVEASRGWSLGHCASLNY
jgi:hypothetical protein